MFKNIAVLSIFHAASADLAAISQRLLQMVGDSSMRAFDKSQIADTVPQLDEFGCWCYFGENVGRGKGQPVDEVDSICKMLADGYECAIRDSEDEGLACTPWEVDYNAGTGSGKVLYNNCLEQNSNNTCAARACTVELNFVETMFAYLLGGTGISYADYSHAQGFDPSVDVGCPVKKGSPGASASKACCGSYPRRFPYKSLDGERGCCGSRTYSTNILQCCDTQRSKVGSTC